MARFSNRPWSEISASDYKDAAAYADACLINENTGPREKWTKDKAHLPVQEPGGAYNRNGMAAAAGALAGARGGVNVSADLKRQAARKLIALYREANMMPTDSLRAAARPASPDQDMNVLMRQRRRANA